MRNILLATTIVSSKGQIALPAEFRQMDQIEPGQEFDVERLGRGDYRLVRRVAPRNEGAINWLLACPYKNFFVPIGSESTDTGIRIETPVAKKPDISIRRPASCHPSENN